MNPQSELDAALAHEAAAFGRAVKAVITADVAALKPLLDAQPELVRQRSASEHQSTLLHYVAANGIEDVLQLTPLSAYKRMASADESLRREISDNVLAVVRLLIDAGSDVDATCETYGGGTSPTTLNLLVSSEHPAKAGIVRELTAALCAAGANVDGLHDDSSPIITAVAFGHPHAARALVEHGARTDNLLLAAIAGDVEQVSAFLSDGSVRTGDVQRCVQPWFPIPDDPKVVAEMALVFASMCGNVDVVKFLLDTEVDIDAIPPGSHMTGRALHTACLAGQLEVVNLLLERGADPTKTEPRYNGMALGWARHGGHEPVIRRIAEFTPDYRRKTEGQTESIKAFTAAVFKGDAAGVNAMLKRYPLTSEQLDGPWFHFDAPAVVQAKSNLALVDVLVAAGADINKKSEWWAGGFGVLDGTDSPLAEQLIQRGAKLDVWSAAELGRLEELRHMIGENNELVHARGPDGKTPLHCSGSVAVAAFLLSGGADINARDIDHESTSAQYLVKKRPDVARYLVEQGCDADILLVAALGDEPRVAAILADDPAAIGTTVDRTWFPTNAADHIYSWILGWYVTPHQVARKFGHDELVRWVFDHSPPGVAIVNACLLGMADDVQRILRDHPQAVSDMADNARRQIAHAARNNNISAVRLMLSAGMPVDAVGQHNATSLHWASYHGNAALAKLLIDHGAPLESCGNDFEGTPLQWALHGCQHGWNFPFSDYAATAQVLLDAGCHLQSDWFPIGNAAVDKVLASATAGRNGSSA